MDNQLNLEEQQQQEDFVNANVCELLILSSGHLKQEDFLKLQLNGSDPEFTYLKGSWLLLIDQDIEYPDLYKEYLASEYSAEFAELYFWAAAMGLDYLLLSSGGLAVPYLPTFEWL